MLQNIQSVASQAGALLDNPDNSIYTLPYLRPFIDLQYEGLDTQLQRMGMQYTEGLVEIPIPAGTIDFSQFTQQGQPLCDMKLPKFIWWKLPQQSAAYYSGNLSERVQELSNPDNLQGVPEWRNANGSIQINASVVDVMVKVSYDQESTTVYDPAQDVIRGTAGILALRVAAAVASARPGMANRAKDLKLESGSAWNAFKTLVLMQRQGESSVPPRMHPTSRGSTSPYLPAPTL